MSTSAAVPSNSDIGTLKGVHSEAPSEQGAGELDEEPGEGRHEEPGEEYHAEREERLDEEPTDEPEEACGEERDRRHTSIAECEANTAKKSWTTSLMTSAATSSAPERAWR